jgi:hypothetical protein
MTTERFKKEEAELPKKIAANLVKTSGKERAIKIISGQILAKKAYVSEAKERLKAAEDELRKQEEILKEINKLK